MKEQERTLYECSHARVNGDYIRCRKGHAFLPGPESGVVSIKRLARGAPLCFKACRECPDFDCMGPPVPPEERGWLKRKEGK